jgi:predicted HTH transcriptional regulator
MDSEAIAWLNQFSQQPLNDHQRLALVYLRQQDMITNRDYRRLNHVDATMAREELRGLVQTGLVAQNGASRWTYYTLKVKDESIGLKPNEEQILAYVKKNGSINNVHCRELLKVDETRAYYLMNKLAESGILRPKGKGRWRVYVLP